MAGVVWKRSPWLIGGQNITISSITLKLEWNYAGNVLKGFEWVKSWVKKGNLRVPRTGNVAQVFDGTIWVEN